MTEHFHYDDIIFILCSFVFRMKKIIIRREFKNWDPGVMRGFRHKSFAVKKQELNEEKK